MKDREVFEAHMRGLNACTRFARQSEAVGGEYRTVTVERAWQLWQAAIKHERSECADLCERLVRDDSDAGECADAIRARGLHTEEGERG